MIVIYTLEEAREIAIKLTEEEYNIPSSISLHNWKRQGLITDVKKFLKEGRAGGRVGLYDKTLPIQIATTAELKEKFSLDKIANITFYILENDSLRQEPYKAIEEYENCLPRDRDGLKMTPSYEVFEEILEAKDAEELEEAKRVIYDYIEDFERLAILRIYVNTWEKYMKKFKRKKDDI